MHGRLVRGPAELVQRLDHVPALLGGRRLQGDDVRRRARSAVEEDQKIDLAGAKSLERPAGLGRRHDEGRQASSAGGLIDEADEIPVVLPVVGDDQVVSGWLHARIGPQIFLNT